MKIHPAEQGSLGWLMARVGVVTASEFDHILTPEFKIRTGETPKSYLAKKVAEAWSGSPAYTTNTFDMDQGHLLESEAIPFVEFEYGLAIQRVGLITTDDGRIGCSPDGLIGEDSGIEIKCPEAATHVRYILNGAVPKEYLAQVHGAMYVTGRSSWRFLSYRRGFPALLIQVGRDPAIQKAIHEALTLFIKGMDEAMAHLVQLNGGPPRRNPPQAITPKPESKPQFEDIIP